MFFAATLSKALLWTTLVSVLTSLESGFAIPVVEDPRNHNSAWKWQFFLSFSASLWAFYDLLPLNYLAQYHTFYHYSVNTSAFVTLTF